MKRYQYHYLVALLPLLPSVGVGNLPLLGGFIMSLLLPIPAVQAFVSPSSTTTTSSHRFRAATTQVHISRHEVEQYRANLENLMRQQNNLENLEQQSQKEHGLTSTARHRRMLEIELMKSLEKSDDAINELMHLWMYENDASMAHELEDMQDECSPGMRYEEHRLLDMIRQFPTWAEPRARLALLFFFQGRTHDSYDVAIDTLKLKPWHFEIYPLLVLLSLRKGEFGQALAWARRALPPHRPDGPNKRRNEWIRIAVELAQDQLNQAETRSQVRGGQPSSSSTTSRTGGSMHSLRRHGRPGASLSDAPNKSKQNDNGKNSNGKSGNGKDDKKPKRRDPSPEDNAWQ